jgi:hypothetical protein
MSDLEQTPKDELRDYTDIRLLEFLHKFGLLSADEEAQFSKKEVMSYIRAAYWQGIADHARDIRGELFKAASRFTRIK